VSVLPVHGSDGLSSKVEIDVLGIDAFELRPASGQELLARRELDILEEWIANNVRQRSFWWV
jgi:hypothetical protein